MARVTRQGVDYFPMDVYTDDKFKFIEIKFKLEGFAVIIKLFQRIYAQGYWCEWGEDEVLIFAHEIGASTELLNEIVTEALKRDIFCEQMYDDYKILTSQGIQKRYTKIANNAYCLYKSQYRLIPDSEIPKYKANAARVRMYSYNVKQWYKIINDVFARDDYTCQYCGKVGGNLEADHIVPFSKGGSDMMCNLTTACRKCNRMKRDKSASDFMKYIEDKGGFE